MVSLLKKIVLCTTYELSLTTGSYFIIQVKSKLNKLKTLLNYSVKQLRFINLLTTSKVPKI